MPVQKKKVWKPIEGTTCIYIYIYILYIYIYIYIYIHELITKEKYRLIILAGKLLIEALRIFDTISNTLIDIPDKDFFIRHVHTSKRPE